MRKITVAIIGAGARGMYAYVPYLKENPELGEVVAVAEPHEIRRDLCAKEYNIKTENVFITWEDLLEKDRLADAIIIANNDESHYEPTKLALEKGYHVLLEKPMSNKLEDIVKLGELAKEYPNQVFMICHVLRYTPFFSKLNEYDMGVFSTPGIWDTIHDYSLKIFESKETIQYAYGILKPYPKACEIIFSINPCYNHCTKKWYRKIWQEILSTEVEVDVKVSMNSFLAYSAYLSKENNLALQYIQEAEKYIEKMRDYHSHFIFPEMRYCIAQLVKLKIEGNSTFFSQPINELLESIDKNVTDEKEYAQFSSKIYIANALVWLGDFELARTLLNNKMYTKPQDFNWDFSNKYIDSSYVLLEPTVNLINSILDTKISSETKFKNTHSFNLKKDYIHLKY